MVKWRISKDTSKILLAAWVDNDEDKIQTQLLLSVQDNQLSNIWKRNFTLPYNQEQLKILNLVLSNTGQVFLSAKVYADKKDKKVSNKKDEPAPLPYKMVIFCMDASSDKAREINPEVPGKFITDVSINVGKQGDLYYAGLYTNDNEGLLTISPEGKMERQKVFDIKKDTGTLLVPKSSKQISSNEFFFVTTGTFKLTGKNMYRLGVIRIN